MPFSLLIVFLLAVPFVEANTNPPASNEIDSIGLVLLNSGWFIGFNADGSVNAVFGAGVPGDAGSVPAGTLHFNALLNAVLRLRVDQRQGCSTQVTISKRAESSGTTFYISDDNLFRYLLASFDGKWQPQFRDSRFEAFVKTRPFFSNRGSWIGRVPQWGTMREVLAENKSEGRVLLNHLKNDHELIGVGALAGLAGEITIYDGRIWITKDDVKAVEAAGESATLLVAARVTEWFSTTQEIAISADQFEDAVRESARQANLDASKPFPFVVEGRLTVEAHVTRGTCPHGGAAAAPQPPSAFSLKDEPAVLVGFFAENSEGNLTHQGTNIHAHVLTKDNPPRMGHVDSASLGIGSTIRVPFHQQP